MRFRFEQLEIWQAAADLALKLDDVADDLESKKKYRYAEQLRGAGISISNNIAEGSGSNSNPDFRRFLYFARKSVFECASMLLVWQRMSYVHVNVTDHLCDELELLSKRIVAFARTLDP
ncbi:four helix bundle protein [Pirellulaceae bacterium SH449]